jgi:hypothetical protein
MRRKKHEKIRSEDYSRRIFTTIDLITDAILLIDLPSMRLVQLHNSACRFYNQTHEQLLATDPWKLLATSREVLEQIYDNLIAIGLETKPLEIRQQSEGGSPLLIELGHQALRSDDQSTLCPYFWSKLHEMAE